MKPDEIRLILIIVVAMMVSALVQDWRSKHPVPSPYPLKNRNAQHPPEPPAPAANPEPED